MRRTVAKLLRKGALRMDLRQADPTLYGRLKDAWNALPWKRRRVRTLRASLPAPRPAPPRKP